ncbi:epidermal growth factor receptor-like [Hetaerina americana]|uniref:epidermal growth factor receptor-like n=1 Tax=Hetaerina americana TaxID=62018 RepID=UPI003A7F61E4
MELGRFSGTLGRLLFTLCTCALAASYDILEEKVCHGTHAGLVEPSDHGAHLRELRERYTGCTFVQGNLELTWIRSEGTDLSFLRHIREVSGYVLLFNVGARRVPLTNLQIIRGEKLMKTTAQREGFAFLATTVTSQYLEMPALREIQRGCVGFLQSYNLCHIKDISWKNINKEWRSNTFDINDSDTECSPCDVSCNGACWGPGPENCQRIDQQRCHSECSGKCFAEGLYGCCHSYCAIGCNGSQPNDCIACKHYINNGACVVGCPRGKYKYGATCVRNCPDPLLKDNDACVAFCPPGKRVLRGECIPCKGLCHKVCDGVDVIHSGNIRNFQNCTTIEGSVEIRDITFTGFQMFHSSFIPGPLYEEMHPNSLEALSNVKEITGHLSIKGSHPSFKDLSFLRSLEIIRGDSLENQAALYIEKTSLKTLGLRSLRTISKGGVLIRENKNLCLLDQNNWDVIKKSPTHSLQIQGNRPVNECVEDGYFCHAQCSSEGCWGTSASECFSCADYKLKELCIGTCRNSSGSAENSSNDDEICFTKAFLPGLTLYIVNENTKELVDGQAWDNRLIHAYVTTHRQYQIWMQHLQGLVQSSENDQANDSEKCPNKQNTWVQATNGAIPVGGLLGGTDPKCMLYVGRAWHEGELLPGKLCARYNNVYIAWNGGEYLYNDYQVLTGSNFEWVISSSTQIPACAVEGGKLKDGTPVYIGRTFSSGALDIGRVNAADGILYIPYYGKEYSFRDYEILVYKSKRTIDKESHDNISNRCSSFQTQWVDGKGGNITTEGLVSTNDSQCNHYVGRTTHEGDIIPGKYYHNNHVLYISWGGEEFTYNQFQVLIGYNYEWIPATGTKIPACAVQGGHTVDGTPLYIGRIVRPGDCTEIGKVNPVDGLLYVGYFSKEYTYTEYDILVFKTA